MHTVHNFAKVTKMTYYNKTVERTQLGTNFLRAEDFTNPIQKCHSKFLIFCIEKKGERARHDHGKSKMKSIDQKIIGIFIDQTWTHTVECDHKVAINQTHANEHQARQNIKDNFFPEVV